VPGPVGCAVRSCWGLFGPGCERAGERRPGRGGDHGIPVKATARRNCSGVSALHCGLAGSVSDRAGAVGVRRGTAPPPRLRVQGARHAVDRVVNRVQDSASLPYDLRCCRTLGTADWMRRSSDLAWHQHASEETHILGYSWPEQPSSFCPIRSTAFLHEITPFSGGLGGRPTPWFGHSTSAGPRRSLTMTD
jgi:hypothetical protein